MKRFVASVLILFLSVLAVYAETGISGRVTDSGGEPVESVYINAYVPFSDNMMGAIIAQPLVHTDSNGQYFVSVSTNGTYRVSTQSGEMNYIDESTNVFVNISQIVSNVNFFLATGGIISGIITGENSNNLNTISMTAYDSDNYQIKSTTTDINGEYEIVGLPTDQYYMKTSVHAGTNYIDEWYNNITTINSQIPIDAQGVDLIAGLVSSNVDFALDIGGVIRGMVTGDGGAPLDNVQIKAYDSNNNMLKSATTDTNGSYEVVGLLTDQYTLWTDVSAGTNYIDEWYGDVNVVGSYVPLEAKSLDIVAGSTTNDVNFSLATGGVISGVIRDETETPLANISVSISSITGQEIMRSYTDTNGAFHLAGLAEGLYRVKVPAGSSSYIAQTMTLILSAGESVNNLDFSLISLGEVEGSISGTITDAEGSPLSGVRIYYNKGDASDLPMFYFTLISTDGDGKYLISNLDAATYNVNADPYMMNYINLTHSNIAVNAGIRTHVFRPKQNNCPPIQFLFYAHVLDK